MLIDRVVWFPFGFLIEVLWVPCLALNVVHVIYIICNVYSCLTLALKTRSLNKFGGRGVKV
jgi:hypothetical protein